MKVLLWILGCLAALAVLLVAAVIGTGVFYGRWVVGKTKDAEEFAAHATHAECAEELARRAQGCGELAVGCIADSALFMAACFQTAQGDRAQFCASVPAAADDAALTTWRGEFCPPRKLAEGQCAYVTDLISGMCAEPQTPETEPVAMRSS